MKQKIYISGMHSGQNPCSGVGIARCIRRAFPHLTLIGVDHWQGSSGLHDASIDDVFLLPQWSQMDNERHSKQVRDLLDQDHLWISALDMEVYWFSEKLGPHKNLLAPGGPALELTAKPAVKAFEGMNFRVPEFISATLSDSEVHSFLRRNSWQCWLKSPYHDAKRIQSWSTFERSRESMSKTWKTSRLFIQRHIMGNEETYAFAAYQGVLLSAVHLEKRQLTPEGKTWAGRVTPVKAELFEEIKEVIRRLEWSGGGEIEFVRDPDGQKWIIECNPRFPAWIFGAALTGTNLPAKLVSKIWDLPLLESVSKYNFFTRVVQEIPAQESVGIPLPPDPNSMVWSSDGKKGKGGPAPGSLPRLRSATGIKNDEDDDEESPLLFEPEAVPTPLIAEIEKITRSFMGETPTRIHLEEWTQSKFSGLEAKLRECRLRSPEVRIGYSLKTSPTDDYLRKAKQAGFYAECISQKEIRRALGFGYLPSEVILNGPGKFWPITTPPVLGLHMLFCDSMDEFERVIQISGFSKCIGFRVRLPKLNSRFGNPLSEFDNFKRIVDGVKKLKGKADLGFHFHMPSWSIGVERWSQALESLFIWCQTFEKLTNAPVKRIDLGGGFFPSDLQSLDLKNIQSMVSSELAHVEAIYFEPGRSLTQDGEILVSRVLDVRRRPDGELLEIVVDACVAELPLAQAYSHRIFFCKKDKRENQRLELLKKGHVRVLGRICMEDDILSNGLDFPDSVDVGDFVVFGDAGGYERSMSYVFGRG